MISIGPEFMERVCYCVLELLQLLQYLLSCSLERSRDRLLLSLLSLPALPDSRVFSCCLWPCWSVFLRFLQCLLCVCHQSEEKDCTGASMPPMMNTVLLSCNFWSCVNFRGVVAFSYLPANISSQMAETGNECQKHNCLSIV